MILSFPLIPSVFSNCNSELQKLNFIPDRYLGLLVILCCKRLIRDATLSFALEVAGITGMQRSQATYMYPDPAVSPLGQLQLCYLFLYYQRTYFRCLISAPLAEAFERKQV